MFEPLVALFLLLSSSVSIDQPTEYYWRMDPAASRLEFHAVEEGRAFEGFFATFSTDIVLNPTDLSTASIVAVVDLGSVDAGNADRNATLPDKEWFWTKKFPEAVFRTQEIRLDGEDGYVAIGALTIKGREVPIKLPFSLSISGNHAVAEGQVTLNRMDFGVGTGGYKSDDWISHQVNVKLHIEADRN